MKKILILLLFALLLGCSFAFEFRPNSVRELDATVLLRAEGSIKGGISPGSEMTVKMLSFQESGKQKIVWIEEEMAIGKYKLKPSYEYAKGNKFAVFKISDLQKYSPSAEFEISIRARVRVTASIGLEDDYNLSKGISDSNGFLLPTKYIESDDRELKSKAALEFGDDSEFETIRAVTEWVNSNIEYDYQNYYGVIESAKHTYNSRRGVCDEFANLTAVFLRIKGIPARYVSGISFDGNSFGNHGWLEAYVPGNGWIGVDSTYGEAGFLDATHIELAKGSDASELSNVIIETRSASAIEVEAKSLNPEVSINSAGFFREIINADLNFPGEVGADEQFSVSAEIENLLGKNAIVPVQLAMHSDFSVEGQKRLVWLRPHERREIAWKIKSNVPLEPDMYAKYDVVFLSPDRNIAEKIEVHPDGRGSSRNAAISVSDVSPYIDGNVLQVDIKLQNSGNEEGEALIKMEYAGGEIISESIIVPANSSRQYSAYVHNIKAGKLLLTITGKERKIFEIEIPENAESGSLNAQPAPENAEENGGVLAGLNKALAENTIFIIACAAAVSILFIFAVSLLIARKT